VPKSPTALLHPPGWLRSRRNFTLLVCAAIALAVAAVSLLSMTAGSAPGSLNARNASNTGPVKLSSLSSGNPAVEAAAQTVHIKNYAYAPAALTIASGTTVTFINDDTASHTVTTTSAPKSFDSKELKTGQSWSYTFSTAGTYSYYCAYHPDMKGTVTVTAASATPTPTPTPTTSMPMPSTSPTATTSPTASPTSSSGTCTGAVTDIFNTILQHIYTAHLERSPSQQVSDALALDQYIKTHTAWVQMILQSGADSAQKFLQGLIPLLQHLYTAHLERSLADQVADALNLNQYLLTHLVLVEDILKPGVGGLLGGPC
jgi:plastocyanin